MVSISQLEASDWVGASDQQGPGKSHILLACMPKSGSTFLSDVISQLPGFRRALLYPSSDRREQELDEFCLREVNRHDYVAQSHTRYSEWTADMCRAYNLTPIVLVRSLLDVIVSLRDHVRTQSHVWPMFFAEPPHAHQDEARLELMIAKLATPWYLNFYMSWRRAPRALMVSYEEMLRDPVALTHRIVNFAGAGAPLEEVRDAVERVQAAARSRLNVGVAGRGAKLRAETIHTVLDLMDYYPEAARDPYFVAVRAQAEAALTGAKAETWPQAVDLGPAGRLKPARMADDLRHWMRKKAKRVMLGRVAPAVLLGLAALYWMWPHDLIPDNQPYGYTDDGMVALLAGFGAGCLMVKNARQRLRRGR